MTQPGDTEGARLEGLLPWLAVALVVVVYLKVAGLGLIFGWDDELYLLGRPEVVDWFSATWRQRLLTPDLGYPVPLPTFLEYLLMQLPGGVRLAAAHLTNLTFHAANTALAYLLAREWLRGRRAAFFAATIWALHPLTVESVAWLTDLKQVTLGTFALGAMWVWQRHLAESGKAGEPDCRNGLAASGDLGPDTSASPGSWTPGVWWRPLATVLLVLAALGCRPEAVVIGPALVVQTALAGTVRFREARIWAPIAAVAVLSMAYLPLALTGQSAVLSGANDARVLDLAPGERLLRMGTALGLNLWHVLWPVELHPYYPSDWEGWVVGAWAGALLYPALLAATWWTVRRRPGAGHGWVLWWLFWAPASGIVYLPRYTADTYMYLPLLGLVVVAVGLAERRLEGAGRRLQVAAVAAAVLVGGLLAWRTSDQIERWETTETLYAPVVERYPDRYIPTSILAWYYNKTEQWERAAQMVREHVGVFFDRGLLPQGLLEGFEHTGEPGYAVRVAIDAHTDRFRGSPEPRLGVYLVWLIVKHGVPVPEDPTDRRIVAREAAQAVEAASRYWPPAFVGKAAGVFAQQGMPATASRYAALNVRRQPEDCDSWRRLEALRDAGGQLPEVEVPERPESCR